MRKKLPKHQYVRISSANFPGFKLGITVSYCKYDNGVVVWIPTEGAKYECIDPSRPTDSIVPIEKGSTWQTM